MRFFLYVTLVMGLVMGRAHAQEACVPPETYKIQLEVLRKAKYEEFQTSEPDRSKIQRMGAVVGRLIQLLSKHLEKDGSLSLEERLSLLKQAQNEQGYCALKTAVLNPAQQNVVAASTCGISNYLKVAKYSAEIEEIGAGKKLWNNDLKEYVGLEDSQRGDLRAAAFFWRDRERERKYPKMPIDTVLTWEKLIGSVRVYNSNPEKLEELAADLLGFDYKAITTFEGWLRNKGLIGEACEERKSVSAEKRPNVESFKLPVSTPGGKNEIINRKLPKKPINDQETGINMRTNNRRNKGKTGRQPEALDQGKTKKSEAAPTEYLIVPE